MYFLLFQLSFLNNFIQTFVKLLINHRLLNLWNQFCNGTDDQKVKQTNNNNQTDG